MAILASHGRLRHSHCIDQGTQEHQCPVCSPAPLVTSEGNEEDKDMGRSGGGYTDDVYSLVRRCAHPRPAFTFKLPCPMGEQINLPIEQS